MPQSHKDPMQFLGPIRAKALKDPWTEGLMPRSLKDPMQFMGPVRAKALKDPWVITRHVVWARTIFKIFFLYGRRIMCD